MDPNTRNYWQPEDGQTPATPPAPVQAAPHQPSVQVPERHQSAGEIPQPIPAQVPSEIPPPTSSAVSSPQPLPAPTSPTSTLPQGQPAAMPLESADATPPQETPTSSDVSDEQPWQLPQQEDLTDTIDHASDTVEWRASEYIHHDKSVIWYIALGMITVVSAGIAAFFQQWLFAILIVVMGMALGVFARRPPREVLYRIGSDGVTIAERTFPFSQFKAFGVLDEGAFYSVQLRPAKRLMPGISIYFARDDGERIFDALAAHLPMEEMKLDPVDKFMRWLRF